MVGLSVHMRGEELCGSKETTVTQCDPQKAVIEMSRVLVYGICMVVREGKN